MALKSYVVKQTIRVPYVQNSRNPSRPIDIKFKKMKKGDIINGELKHSNNRPAFILVKGVLPVPVWAVKELVTKEIVSKADGSAKIQDKTITAPPSKKDLYPGLKVADAVIVGAIAGAIGTWGAEKKGWIKEPANKNKIIGAVAGGILFGYIAYRMKNQKAPKKR